MAKVGALENLLAKEHAHTFVNTGGDVRLLDFRFKLGSKDIGAPFHGRLPWISPEGSCLTGAEWNIFY